MEETGLIGKKARQLLRYEITQQGEVPNPFDHDFYEVVQYILDRKYVIEVGRKGDALQCKLTPEGEKWALGK